MGKIMGGSGGRTSALPVFASPEVATFWRFIASSLDRLMSVLDGCTVDQLNYRPPAEEANSLYVLAIHTLGNVRENILGVLCGQPVKRERDDEFAVTTPEGGASIPWWPSLRDALEEALSVVSSDDLDRTFDHPRRDPMSGRAILIVIARHAAEHLGQAELTRDLAQTASTTRD